MKIISHRVNSISELKETPESYGVEIDIRYNGEDLFISHDPSRNDVLMSDWLNYYSHCFLIVNVKEDGLEDLVINLLNNCGITSFFFLDQPFPSIMKMARKGERRCAVRISEYESHHTALNVSRFVDWVWVDQFTTAPPDFDALKILKEKGLKLCLVSPELQGREMDSVINLQSSIRRSGFDFDAVCTKYVDIWNRFDKFSNI